MSDYLTSVLDELVPRFAGEKGDWGRVLADASIGEAATMGYPWPVGATATSRVRRERHRRWPIRRLTRRRLVVIAVALVAIAVPLIAAASQSWWFFRFAGTAPEPISDVTVVRSGTWDGKPWQLVAYLSATDGVCFGLSPTATVGSTGEGAALSCDQIEGVPRTKESKPYAPHAITFLAGSSLGFPAYVVGPVVDSADEVSIHFGSGATIRTPTFDAPDELGSIRFYATQVPELEQSPGERPESGVQKLVGLTKEGQIVACLVVPMPEAGVALSACR